MFRLNEKVLKAIFQKSQKTLKILNIFNSAEKILKNVETYFPKFKKKNH